MRTIEELEAGIMDNSYSVELSNGQTIYIDKSPGRQSVSVYIKNGKAAYGYENVVSVKKDDDRQAVIQRIENSANHIIYPDLVNFAKIADYHAAKDALKEEIADAILSESKPFKEVMPQIEEGAVYENFKEEMSALKAIDETLYTSILTRTAYYHMNDDEFKHFCPFTGENFLNMHRHDIRSLMIKFKKKHPEEVAGIVKAICEKWDYVEEYEEWLDDQDL